MVDFIGRLGTAVNEIVNKARTASWKALIPLVLDVLTFFLYAALALLEREIDHMAFAMWLGFLAGLGGFALATFNTERKTDYGFVERTASSKTTTETKVGDASAATSTEVKPS